MINRRVLLALLTVTLILSIGGFHQSAQASPTAQTNLLTNPGFEDPFIPFQNDPTRMVANGWSAWHVPQRDGDEGFRNLKPEYQPASASNPDRILAGTNAQEYFSFFATHTGGVYQQVQVPTGSELDFSVSVYVWSTNADNVDTSESPGRVQVQVGIDPNGGTDGESERIIWSLPLEFYDAYEEVSVRVPDVSDRVTAFVRTTFDLPQKNNIVYLDNAALVITSSAEPTATATTAPSETPVPTETAMATATTVPATNTPANTAAPGLATPTQEIGDGDETEEPFASATPTAVPTSEDFPYQFTYRVVAGDTVGDIARRFNSSIRAIIDINRLNADGLIFVGDELIIPVSVEPTPTTTPTYSPTSLGIIPTNTPVGILPTPTAVPPTAVPPAQPETTLYSVQAGDTLNRIAARYGTTAAAIAQLNGILNPNLILVGQQLQLPGTVQVTPEPPPQPDPQPRQHVVQPGENLFRISLRYGVPVNTLAQLNGIFNVNQIFVGQVLQLP